MTYFLTLFFCLQSMAAFDQQITLGNENLILNGSGLRTATILGIKVYEAALYVKQKSNEPNQLVASYPRKVELVFLRNVDKSDIANAFEKGFENNCEKNCEALKPAIDRLNKMVVGVKEQDKMAYTFWEDRVEVAHNGNKLGEIKQAGFAENLLLTWIGKEPPTQDLKKGLLGQ